MLLLSACGEREAETAPPSSDQLIARSVEDVRAANAALAAPHEPSRSIAEIARPASPARQAVPPRAGAPTSVDGTAADS